MNHTSFYVSRHFWSRAQQRKISDSQIKVTLQFGTRVWNRGEGCYAKILLRKDIPDSISHDTARRIEGTVVIVSETGTLVTTYRNPEIRIVDLKKRPRWSLA
jgi:hypothetical protein